MYPMKVRHYLLLNEKNNVEGDHHPSPRAFQENISFSFVKEALGKSLKAKETSPSATFGSTASLN